MAEPYTWALYLGAVTACLGSAGIAARRRYPGAVHFSTTTGTLWRAALAGAVLVAGLTACGDTGLLDGLGERTQTAVLGEVSTTSTIPIVVGEDDTLGVVLASDVAWWNDNIEGEATGEKNYIVARVWERNPHQRFHQASRLEIVQAIPNIGFPGIVPEDVRFITSQLVYDTASATLDAEFSAAFGLWPVEPYTVQDASLAVLRVGDADEFRIDGIVADVVNDGLSLSWTAGQHRYELFCRTGVNDELCWQMAESTVNLTSLLPTTT